MSNPFRGEVTLVVDGDRRILRLTLGALVELEEQLETESLLELIGRFERGAFKTRDLIALIVAGLKGGGWDGDEQGFRNGPIEVNTFQSSKSNAIRFRSQKAGIDAFMNSFVDAGPV